MRNSRCTSLSGPCPWQGEAPPVWKRPSHAREYFAPLVALSCLLWALPGWGREARLPARGDAPLRARPVQGLPLLAVPPLRAEPPGVAEAPGVEQPVPVEAWVAWGAFSLAPLVALYAAGHSSGERLWVVSAQAAAGAVAGWLPARLLFLYPAQAGGRQAELDVAAFGAGLVLTPPLAALGTWGLGEVAFQGSRDAGGALLGALAGAAVGTLLGVAIHGVLEEAMGNRPEHSWVREWVALELVGVGAAVGYQQGGGGPR